MLSEAVLIVLSTHLVKKENKEVIKYPNRKPTKKEILAHAPFLDYEIKCVKPKIIVTVGTTALTRLLDDKYEISNVHGKIIENTPILELNDKKRWLYLV